jgi:predicted XRE-type DNA-binding protein
MKIKNKNITHGSENIFADLGFANAEELQLKTKLTHLVTRLIKKRGWTQQQAAKALGVKQPDISALVRGEKLEHYSVERLMHFLDRLEQDVTITVKGREWPKGEIILSL